MLSGENKTFDREREITRGTEKVTRVMVIINASNFGRNIDLSGARVESPRVYWKVHWKIPSVHWKIPKIH